MSIGNTFVTAVMLLSCLPAVLIFAVFYIFNAIGLYTLSKRRGYDKPWLAWIPFARAYLLGKIADNINVCSNKKTANRIWTLIADVLGSITYFIACIGILRVMLSPNFMKSIINDSMNEEALFLMLPIVMLSLLYSLFQLVRVIFFSIAQYRIYSDYSPTNAVAFVILGIFFQLSPFFLFSIRNKPSISAYYSQNPQQPNSYQQSQNYYQS